MSTERNRLSSKAYADAPKLGVRFVLENIRSGQNVGAFFRTGDAFRIEGVDLCGYTAHPPHRDILKSALGASEHVAWRGHESATEAIAVLRSEGFHIAVIEQTDSSIMLQDWSPKAGEKWALVFGNEVRGVELNTTEAADISIEIPQFGVKQSLNVSVCGGMVLWEAARKMGLPQVNSVG